MSEFDFRKNWTVKVGNGSKNYHAQHHTLENMIRAEVMQWIAERGLVNYRLESE